jgi:hypothetical protein
MPTLAPESTAALPEPVKQVLSSVFHRSLNHEPVIVERAKGNYLYLRDGAFSRLDETPQTGCRLTRAYRASHLGRLRWSSSGQRRTCESKDYRRHRRTNGQGLIRALGSICK